MKNSGTFCCVFQHQTVEKGNQHGGRKYDDYFNDLQNWLDMTSHENPYFEFISNQVYYHDEIACTFTHLGVPSPTVYRD